MNRSDLGAVDQSAPPAALDAALIARLAEFFTARPPNPAAPAFGLPAPPPAVTVSPAAPAAPEGVAAFVPENPGAVPAQGAPSSRAYIPNAGEPAPLNVPPSFPVASDLFAFPSVPGMQLAPENPGAIPAQGVPGSPAYLRNATEPAPLNLAPSFPVASDLFAFPGVPDMQSVPDVSAVAVPARDKTPTWSGQVAAG